MFNFNLLFTLQLLKRKKQKQMALKDLAFSTHSGPIRAEIEHMTRCNNCHFLIFENYWDNNIEQVDRSVCPTCGSRL